MTRQEQTGKRPLDFSLWVRRNLPDSYGGFMVSDLDFIFWNYKTKRFAFLEIKTRGSEPRPFQRNLFEFLNKCIVNGKPEDWIYEGFHLIQFQNTFFNDGNVYLDNKLSSENEIKERFSF